jgi:outer membrane lipoprotein-sorting protein
MRLEEPMKKATAIVLSAAVLLTLAALPGFAQKAPSVQSSKEALGVLDKMVDAMGGKKALEAIKDTTVKGTVEISEPYPIKAPITLYQKEPNMMRLDIFISIPEANVEMTVTQAYDGEKGWFVNPQTMATEETPDFLTKELARQALGNDSFLNPQKLGITYALKPKATIEGKDYIVLEQTLPDGHKNTMFLDPVTYLPFKQQTKTIDQSGAEVDAESFMSNYQKVGGIMVAYSMRVLHNGTEAQRLTIEGVTYNSNIEDAFFKMK